MNIRYFLLLPLLCLSSSACVFAQQYNPYWQWAVADTNASSPVSSPEHVWAAKNKKAFWGRLQNNKLGGNIPEGDYLISEYDSAGHEVTGSYISGKLHLLDAQADASGNWYVLGQFYDSLLFANHTLSLRSPGSIEPDYFMARFNAGSLSLGWMKIIGGNNQASATSFTIANNKIYIPVDTGSETQIRSMTLATGDYTLLFSQTGKSTSSSIQADNAGNIYLAGSCAFGGLNFNGVIQNPVGGNPNPDYVVRYSANGIHSWHYWLHDVTCTGRKLTLANNNLIYYSGDLHDSLTLGNVHLHHPAWVYDYVAARLDSSGNVAWARQVDTVGGGDASLSNAYQAVVTPDTALVIFPETRMYMDWRNNVITSAGNTYSGAVVSFRKDGVAKWARLALAQITTNQHIATDGDAVWITGNGFSNLNYLGFDTLHLIVPPQKYIPYMARLKLTPPPVVQQGVSGVNGTLLVRVYPNPATNELRITGLAALKEPATITLMDVSGKVLMQQQLTPAKNGVLIDVAAVPRGFIFVEVTCGAGRSMQKVMLQ